MNGFNEGKIASPVLLFSIYTFKYETNSLIQSKKKKCKRERRFTWRTMLSHQYDIVRAPFVRLNTTEKYS